MPAIHASNILFTPIDASQGLSDNQIRYILQLSDGRMVFTTNGNVNLYDGVHFSYLHRTPQDMYSLRQYDGHYRIYQNGDSLLWIKDMHKLMCINLHTEQYITDLTSYFHRKNIQETVDNLFVDDADRTWVLTPKGLQELETGRQLPLPTDKQKQLQDLNSEDNHLFLFYNTGELACYDITDKKLLYSKAAYPASEQTHFQRTSLVIKGEKGFYQLRNGDKGGFFFFDRHRRTWKKLFEQNYSLNTLIITPHDEKAYISCIHGFWSLDLADGNPQYSPVLETRKGQLVSTEISTIFQDRQGGLWVGTVNRGLLYHHPAMYKLTYISRNSFPVSPEEDLAVEAFAEDKDGTVYLKSHSKVYRLTPDKEGLQKARLTTVSSVPAGLSEKLSPKPENYFQNKPYTALYTDTRGWTWAGTPDGLELFKHPADSPRIFYRENGLSNNFVQGIIEDKHRHIWVTTSNGISRIHVNPENEEITFTNFNQLDGALEGEYVRGAIFQSTDGTLYFGGIDGFTIFHPDKEPVAPPLPYAPVFTALHLYGEKVNTGESYGKRILLPQSPPYTNHIELDYNQNFLTFNFSALNYVNSERTYYRYQLEGIDPDWRNAFTHEQGNATVDKGILQVSYTNLPSGTYLFKVTASDNLSLWNGKITKVKVVIHAPWWRTTTAYVVYLLALLLLAITGVRLYAYRTRKKMEREHKEEILLLRIRNLIEQCNAYEAEQKVRAEEKSHSEEKVRSEEKQDSAESAFLSRAIELVEKNLHVSGYSVEQLSRDLCMERTGLYRKLVTLLDQSPSLFIRNIRLQRAAQLLLEENLSVAEIAERTGFSSSSYLSKCFQEMYGCRPSEYAEKNKKST